ncbi:MAG: ribosomal RNA small subunit methyltransferase A [candidate division Zixibacteria bacterium]|nr:ribosomal RNA small subunit methyltransferase A [candidate division Zixibacteria bacterium]
MPPKAKKRFGQHFLNSDIVIARIVEAIEPAAGEAIVEIGPGRGALTVPLAESGARVLAVEIERSAYATITKSLASCENVSVVNRDFLSMTAEETGFDRFKLVGNLPYNITSPVIDWVVENRDRIVSALFMVQREVANRLTSQPGTKDWSPMAILTGLFFDIENCFDVSPESFTPPPKVDSTVIRLAPSNKPQPSDYSKFEQVVRASFRSRRKQLANNLVPHLCDKPAVVREILQRLNIPQNIRAEQLPTEKFFELTEYLVTYKILS